MARPFSLATSRRSRDDLDVVALGAVALPHYLATAPRHELVAAT